MWHIHYIGVFSILARDSTYAERAMCYRPCVRPSIRHTGGSVKNWWTLGHAFFTVQFLHPSSFCGISFIEKFSRGKAKQTTF